MAEYDHLMSLAKNAAQMAMQALMEISADPSCYSYSQDIPREMKATADRVLEELILNHLKPTGLPVLSEEAGDLQGNPNTGLKWIVDPLDGTVNFMRGLAPCAVSIALYLEELPVFGVISEYPSRKLAWGGRSFGAFIDGHPISVSTIRDKDKAVLCTGFPARFELTGASAMDFIKLARPYGKVRMLGAAALSLLHVAQGSADAYAEQDIMLWDVAAGIALVEGAGGYISVASGHYRHSLNIFASNGLLQAD